MRIKSIIAIVLLFLASCVDESEYQLSDVSLTPTMALPLAFGDLGLVQILSNEDSSYLKVYEDGLLYLYYAQTFPSSDVRDLFEVPDNQSTPYFSLPAGTLPASSSTTLFGTVNKIVDFNLNPEKLSEMLLKGGTFDHAIALSVPTSPNLPFEVILTLTDVKHAQTQVPLTFTAGAGSGSHSLDNYLITMDQNKFNVKLDLYIKPHAATFIPAGTRVNCQMTFHDMDFAYIKGFLGDQTATIPLQTIPLTVFSSSLKDASVSFVAPSIHMTIVNDHGVPVEATFTKLEAKKPGSTLALAINPTSPVNITYPVIMGAETTTDIAITNANAIISFNPTQLDYSANVRINKGLTSGSNFLADSSRLKVTLATEVPLYGKASGIQMVDTLDIDLGDMEESEVSTASLKFKVANEMPLDANMQIYFSDESYTVLDSLFRPNQTLVVKASHVSANGELETVGNSELVLTLDPEKITKLFNSKFLIVRCVLNTAKDENGVLLNVKFKSSYRLKLNVGLLAKLNLSIK